MRVVEDERAQALVLIVAGGAPLEVGAQLGKLRVDVVSGELELDEAVELVEDSSQPTSGPGRAECLIEFRFAPLCRLLSGRVARDAGLLQVSAQLAPSAPCSHRPQPAACSKELVPRVARVLRRGADPTNVPPADARGLRRLARRLAESHAPDAPAGPEVRALLRDRASLAAPRRRRSRSSC